MVVKEQNEHNEYPFKDNIEYFCFVYMYFALTVQIHSVTSRLVWVKVNLMADIHNKQEAAQQGPAVLNAKLWMLRQNPNVVVDVAVIWNIFYFVIQCEALRNRKYPAPGVPRLFPVSSNINRASVVSSNHGHGHDFVPLPETLKASGQTFFEHPALSQWHVSLQGHLTGCTINLLAVWSPVKPPVSSNRLMSQIIEEVLLVHFLWLSVIPLEQQHSPVKALIPSYTPWGHAG